MIPETPAKCQSLSTTETLSWQSELQTIITDPGELWKILELPTELLPQAYEAHALFPLKAPRPFIARMQKGDINDPLLRQVLPLGIETETHVGFSADPLQEQNAVNPHPGLLHKYQGRVLLIATGICAINCRYCFRRQFPYEANNPGRSGWKQSLDYIAADASIHEVILSGGDPLMSSDQMLAWFMQELSAIAHVKIIRIHTRLPIVIPQRVTSSLLEALTTTRLNTVMVLHSNHAQEIDSAVAQAANDLKSAGIMLLNQSVLLKGINDNAQALMELSYRLFDCGVIPYYLHQCDRVNGSAHFEVGDNTALVLHQTLKDNLAGYLVPRLVREISGEASKIWLN